MKLSFEEIIRLRRYKSISVIYVGPEILRMVLEPEQGYKVEGEEFKEFNDIKEVVEFLNTGIGSHSFTFSSKYH